MRENGYYWVKFCPERWEAVDYTDGIWYYEDEEYSDNDLHQINETRIVNPDEKGE